MSEGKDNTDQGSKPQQSASGRTARAERLATQLRENLKKRKALARARRHPEKD